MSKEDYIKLIQVAEGIVKLEEASKIISGRALDDGECYQVYFLWEVLRSNASENIGSRMIWSRILLITVHLLRL